MKLRDKLIELLGGVPKAKYGMMRTMWECESNMVKGLLRKYGDSIEVASSVRVYPEMVAGMSEDSLDKYVEEELYRGLLSGVKQHMVVQERRDITGVVTYIGTIMVFERNEER